MNPRFLSVVQPGTFLCIFLYPPIVFDSPTFLRVTICEIRTWVQDIARLLSPSQRFQLDNSTVDLMMNEPGPLARVAGAEYLADRINSL
jgi:hypothetical protein